MWVSRPRPVAVMDRINPVIVPPRSGRGREREKRGEERKGGGRSPPTATTFGHRWSLSPAGRETRCWAIFTFHRISRSRQLRAAANGVASRASRRATRERREEDTANPDRRRRRLGDALGIDASYVCHGDQSVPVTRKKCRTLDGNPQSRSRHQQQPRPTQKRGEIDLEVMKGYLLVHGGTCMCVCRDGSPFGRCNGPLRSSQQPNERPPREMKMRAVNPRIRSYSASLLRCLLLVRVAARFMHSSAR